jgi:hypothetical protein
VAPPFKSTSPPERIKNVPPRVNWGDYWRRGSCRARHLPRIILMQSGAIPHGHCVLILNTQYLDNDVAPPCEVKRRHATRLPRFRTIDGWCIERFSSGRPIRQILQRHYLDQPDTRHD